jgi:hypothetical protein
VDLTGKIGFIAGYIGLLGIESQVLYALLGIFTFSAIGLLVWIIVGFVGYLLMRQDPAIRATGFRSIGTYTNLSERVGFALFLGGSLYLFLMTMTGHFLDASYTLFSYVLFAVSVILIIVGGALWLRVQHDQAIS